MALEWDAGPAEEAIRRRASAIALDVAEHVLEIAIGEVPVDTGALRDSGEAVPDPAPGEATVRFGMPYARYVEFGTKQFGRFRPPNAFLRRALLRTAQDAPQIMGAR